MPVLLVLALAFVPLVGLVAVYLALIRVTQRLARLESLVRLERVEAALPESAALGPLYGLRVSVEVTQDHAHPVFAVLLKERLLREDVAEVIFGASEDADVRISGTLTCNGYADVYYQAEFTCRTRYESICTVMEKPAGGDRPENLALELVTGLSRKLDEILRRNERRKAIEELRGPTA